MRYLSLGEVVRLHHWLLESSGGASGIRDLGMLDSALAQPRATFDGKDRHPTLIDKAAALCASLVQNHPFVDGNKRIGHAAMATFLLLNGTEIVATTDRAGTTDSEPRRWARRSSASRSLASDAHQEARF